MQHTNHVKMVVEVCGIIEIGFTLQIRVKATFFLACWPLSGQAELLRSKICRSIFLHNLKKMFYPALDDFLGKKSGNLLANVLDVFDFDWFQRCSNHRTSKLYVLDLEFRKFMRKSIIPRSVYLYISLTLIQNSCL